MKIAAVDIAESTGLSRQDHVAVEQPLEIRVAAHAGDPQPLAITMRTPADDDERCAGFLFTKGLVHRRQDIATLAQTADDAVLVGLGVGIAIEPHRRFAVTSACGVCGRTGRCGCFARTSAATTPSTRSWARCTCATPKSLMAQIPILAAVGAPSSLAVSLAREAGMTLIGFLRDGRFNIYAGGERIANQ